MQLRKSRGFLVRAVITGMVFAVVVACADPFDSKAILNSNGPGTPAEVLSICSPLSFEGIHWPSGISTTDQAAFELALNISGSFEGSVGWQNIAGNSDGQGLSLGILNQNLGQGTLQPLLIHLKSQDRSAMTGAFSGSDFSSLEGMLSSWQSMSRADVSHSLMPFLGTPFELLPQSVQTADAASIAWAKRTILNTDGRTLNARWKNEFVSMAGLVSYVDLQIGAAWTMHQKTLQLVQQLQILQLRAYLFVFDVLVQNGSFYSSDISTYLKYLSAHPSSTVAQRLTELLALVLTHVNARSVINVRERKTAIINGSGIVDQTSRNLQKQYCYDGQTPLQ